MHPLAFLRGTLCLDSKYRKSKSCGELEADGYAHHAYTTSAGPRFKPANTDDVTIGVLSRLTGALDKAAKAGALPKHLPVYLTEFGIQSTPDKVSGVSLAKQAAYMAISEHMAYVNPRVVAFSQYLLSDDPPRSEGYRYGGFESGLRSADGKAKPAYEGFRLPLAVEVYGTSDVLWGLVRPQRAVSKVTIERKPKGGLVADAEDAGHDRDRRLQRQDHPQVRADLPRQVDRARRQDLHGSCCAGLLGSEPHPVSCL